MLPAPAIYGDSLVQLGVSVEAWYKDKLPNLCLPCKNLLQTFFNSLTQKNLFFKLEIECTLQIVARLIALVGKVKEPTLDDQKALPVSGHQTLRSVIAMLTDKQEAMFEMNVFLARLFSIVSHDLSQARRIHSEAERELQRHQNWLKNHLKSYLTTYEIFIETNTLKADYEHLFELRHLMIKEQKHYEEMLIKLQQALRQHYQARNQLYSNLIDNLKHLDGLYQKVFHENTTEQLWRHFQKCKQDSIAEYSREREAEVTPVKEATSLFRSSDEELDSVYQQFLASITVKVWNVIYQSREVKAFLTLDNHLLLVSQRALLEQLKFHHKRHLEASIVEDGIQVKHRKTKESFILHFDTTEREDQFLLHMQTLKLSLNK